MFILDGKPLSPDAPFEHDGISYPANWLRLSTQLDRDRLGITEVPDPQPYDQRFYWGYDQDGALIPKDHDQLVEQWTQQTRTTANTLLQPTDWIIIREADNGKPADATIKQWRQDIRTATGVKVTAIEQTADTDELAGYVTSANYSTWPSDPDTPANPDLADGFLSAVDGFTSGSMITG